MSAIHLGSLQGFLGARRRRRRLGLGEGSGHGQTSTRGQKGQRGRSGDGKLEGFEGGQTPLLRRVPKRGFSNRAFQTRYESVSLARIEKAFPKETEITPETLRKRGLAAGGKLIKILSDGALTRPYKISAHAFSAPAEQKIMKAGGTAAKLKGK